MMTLISFVGYFFHQKMIRNFAIKLIGFYQPLLTANKTTYKPLIDMKISLGADHAGYAYKQRVVDYLLERKVEVVDHGTNGVDSVDYPDYVHPVADDVAARRADCGIIFCASGNGAAMTANKHPGVRAALAWTPRVALLARAHNCANVLSIPSHFVAESDLLAIVDAYLNAEFEGGRHQRRIDKIPFDKRS